jgi:DNA-binding MarR family transcriptional regulator
MLDPDVELDDGLLDRLDGWLPQIHAHHPFDPPISRSVHGAYHAFTRSLSQAARELGVGASEALVLVCLLESPGCAPAVVRHARGFHRSTLSSILKRLEQDGYLSRGASYDGRRFILNLTAQGDQAARLAQAAIEDVEAQVAAYTSRTDRRGADAVFAACVAIAPGEGDPDI